MSEHQKKKTTASSRRKSTSSSSLSSLPYGGKPTVIMRFDRDVFRMNLQGLPMFLFSPLKVVHRYNMDRIHLYGLPRKTGLPLLHGFSRLGRRRGGKPTRKQASKTKKKK